MIETRFEEERGCGFRKPGGLYLMGGGLMAPCDRLPIPLRVCPVCGQGIKPTRGFGWIALAELLARSGAAGQPCETDNCAACPFGGAAPGRAGILWVGSKFYTPESFAREALTMGVSRRIPSVPKGLKPGETWVVLAHRKVPGLGEEGQPGPGIYHEGRPGPGIFHAFRPSHVEYVVQDDDDEEKLERLSQRGIVLVRVEGAQGPRVA